MNITTKLSIRGIAANGAFPGGELAIPLEDITDWRGGYFLPDHAQHVAPPFVVYKLFDDLSRGAWNKWHRPETRQYDLPAATGTGDAMANGPLAWTLRPDAPLLCGAGWQEENPAGLCLRELCTFKGEVWGIDTNVGLACKIVADAWQFKSTSGWRATANGGVTAVSNASGLCKVTTDTAHGLSTGASVILRGITGTGNVALLNHAWTLTKIDATSFTLDGSAWSGSYTGGGVWYNDLAGLTATPTAIYPRTLNGVDTTLFVGQGAAGDGTTARRFDGTGWSNFLDASGAPANAQHFLYVGATLWYSSGNQLIERVATNARKPRIGSSETAINRLAYLNDGQNGVILAGKPEGVYAYNPALSVNSVQPLVEAPPDALNGRVLVVHDGCAWFGMGDRLYSYRPGELIDRTFARFEGSGATPFYSGQVIGGYSNGARLFLLYRVTRTSAFDYYLVIYTGAEGGFHPVLFLTSSTAPTVEPAGILYSANRLRYSFSVDASRQSRTGWLYTDGNTPFGDNATPFAQRVALTTGWVDIGNNAAAKWWRELRLSLVDQGNMPGWRGTLYYKRWGDASWTLIGETAAGSQEGTVLTIPPAAGCEAGITGNRVQFKVELDNISGAPTQAGYIKDLAVVALPTARPNYRATVRVSLRESRGEPGSNPAVILDGLRGGIAQAAPVTLTHPDHGTLTGKLLPGGEASDELQSYSRAEQRVRARTFIFQFVGV